MSFRNKKGRLTEKVLLGLILFVVAFIIIEAGILLIRPEAATPAIGPGSQGLPQSPADTQQTEPPVEEAPYITSTVTIGSAGDILIHKPILESAKENEGYSFEKLFTYVKDTTSAYDYFLVNLETTLAGNENRAYSTYPRFNTPDALLDAVKQLGTDCLLTSNNHSYDTGRDGFYRTAKTVDSYGFDRIGTRLEDTEKKYLIKEIGGIRFGFICYTYETEYDSDTIKALNGLTMNSDTSPLICSFDYDHLDTFYEEISGQLELMRQEGAEVLTVYMHWGDEYKLSANSWQKKMAQELCDMGVDVIIGGHPHVVEPVSLLTSSEGDSKTVCIYSMGNFVSNQRRDLMGLKTGHTEDGAIFEMTFSKYSDGTVYFESVDVTPTWVHLYTQSGKKVHSVVPLSEDMDAAALGLNKTSDGASEAKKSYERTMELVGEGLDQCNAYLDSVLRPGEEPAPEIPQETTGAQQGTTGAQQETTQDAA